MMGILKETARGTENGAQGGIINCERDKGNLNIFRKTTFFREVWRMAGGWLAA
jgi:hypothetical protein